MTRFWWRRLFGVQDKLKGTPGHRAHPARLRVEHLEDRSVPAFTLGTTALVEGPSSGTATDIVVGSGAWIASANDSWFHTTSSGTGNGQAVFSFDAKLGPPAPAH